MSLTRAQAEAMLVRRCGRWMSRAKMAVVTDGTNADLNDPIRLALQAMGLAVADVTSVSDADLVALDVATTKLDEFLDRAEVRTLESVLGNMSDPDITVEGIGIKQATSQLVKLLDGKREALRKTWGLIGGGISIGTFSGDFQQDLPTS